MRVRGPTDRQPKPVSPTLVAAVRPEVEFALSEEELLDLVASGAASPEEVMALGALMDRSSALADAAPARPSDETLALSVEAAIREGADAHQAAEAIANESVQNVLAQAQQARTQLERAIPTAEQRKAARHGINRGKSAAPDDPNALQEALQGALELMWDGTQTLGSLDGWELAVALGGVGVVTGGLVKTVVMELAPALFDAFIDGGIEKYTKQLADQIVALAYNTTVEGLEKLDPEVVAKAQVGAEAITAIMFLPRRKAAKAIKRLAGRGKKGPKKPAVEKVDTPDTVQPPNPQVQRSVTQGLKKVDGPEGPQLQKPSAQPPLPRGGGPLSQAQTRMTRTRGGGQPRPSSRFSGSNGSDNATGSLGAVLLDPQTSARLSGVYSGLHEGFLMAGEGKLGSLESMGRIVTSGLLGYAGGRGGNMINRRLAENGPVLRAGANVGLGAITGAAGGGTSAVMSGEPVGSAMGWGALGGGLSGLLGSGGGEFMGARAGGMQNQWLSDLGQGLAISAGSTGSLLADYFAGRSGQEKRPKADPYTWNDLLDDLPNIHYIMRNAQ